MKSRYLAKLMFFDARTSKNQLRQGGGHDAAGEHGNFANKANFAKLANMNFKTQLCYYFSTSPHISPR